MGPVYFFMAEAHGRWHQSRRFQHHRQAQSCRRRAQVEGHETISATRLRTSRNGKHTTRGAGLHGRESRVWERDTIQNHNE